MRAFTFVFVLLFSFSCAATGQWTVMDKAALAGYLMHPEMSIKYNDKPGHKHIKYDLYYSKSYLSKDSIKLVRQASHRINFFYYYVLKQQKGIIDTVVIYANHKKSEDRYKWFGTFENIRKYENIGVKSKMMLLERILVYPCELYYSDKGKDSEYTLKLDERQGPKFKTKLNRKFYAKMLAWVAKDFAGSEEFLWLNVEFRNGNILHTERINMKDENFFADMYHHKFFHKTKKK